MNKPKYDYIMDYISDKDTYKAVMFACKMIRDGKDFNSAIRTACRYYDTDMDDVRHYVSQIGRRRQVESEG